MKYKFEKPLIEGLIKSRPNRFLMEVVIGGKKQKCYCPSTGRIGNIIFEDIPCLVSKSENKNRKTKYTVEAISLDSPKKKSKNWIGINQNSINKYVGYFLTNKQFSKMIKGGEKTKSEVKLGKSRIDFQVGDNFVEVKMLLINLPSRFDKLEQTKPQSKPDSFNRLMKHFEDLSKSIKKESRAIMLLCYEYDAKPFSPPKTTKDNSKIKKEAKKAEKAGLETWQANFKITPTGIELKKYFKLRLFD